VVERAATAGLTVIALTDHDTVAGIAEARDAATGGLRVLSGCEFSIRLDADGGEIHLLGYGMRSDDPDLLAFLAGARDGRSRRGERILALLEKLGVALTPADLESQAKGAALGRPHVARALLARGVVKNLDQAFDRFLGRGRPAYVPKVLPNVDQVTALVRAAGGVSAIAHPKDRLDRPTLERLRERGVDGIEVRHPSHPPGVRTQLERIAQDLGMLSTGGSDAHGEAAASPSHSVIGGERVPTEWVERIEALARSRGGG